MEKNVKSENADMRGYASGEEKDLVSIVIPTHNYGRYISEAIESVLDQSYSNLEVIVVDDGSTDNTAAIVSKYPSVKYVYQDHIGQSTAARALNIGIRFSSGKYVAALGADDQLLPSYIQECLEAIRKDPKIGIVWTGSLKFGDDKRRLESKFFSPQVKSPHTRFSFYATPGGPIGAGLVARRVYEDVGTYDENLASYEDWDFAIRVLHRRWKARSIDKPLYKYRMHGANIHSHIHKIGLKQLYRKYLFMFPYRTLHTLHVRVCIFVRHPTLAARKIKRKLYKIDGE
jgi:hypothetical protein